MKHILVVDDEEDLLELLKMILKDQFKITTAINGAIALQKLPKYYH